jgi:hypothetical protein
VRERKSLVGATNDTAQQPRGTSEISVTKSLPALAVCCRGWFGVPRYQNRHRGFLAAAGSRAPELPGLLPADARYYRSRRAMQFGIGGSSG